MAFIFEYQKPIVFYLPVIFSAIILLKSAASSSKGSWLEFSNQIISFTGAFNLFT